MGKRSAKRRESKLREIDAAALLKFPGSTAQDFQGRALAVLTNLPSFEPTKREVRNKKQMIKPWNLASPKRRPGEKSPLYRDRLAFLRLLERLAPQVLRDLRIMETPACLQQHDLDVPWMHEAARATLASWKRESASSEAETVSFSSFSVRGLNNPSSDGVDSTGHRAINSDHLEWLVRYQVNRETFEAIGATGPTRRAVEKAVRLAAEQFELPLRAPDRARRGRPPKGSSRK